MGNRQYVQQKDELKEISSQLRNELSILVQNLDNNIFPTEEGKKYICDLIRKYMECSKNQEEKSVVKSKTFDSKKVINEILSDPINKNILLKLAKEKLFKKDEMENNNLQYLIDENLCEERTISNQEYIILSPKAVWALKNEVVKKEIINNDIMDSIPSPIVFADEKFDDVKLCRMEQIRKYYQINGYEYFIFSLSEDGRLPLGCKIGNDIEIEYTFSCKFYDEEESDINELKAIASSRLVDKLVLLVDNLEEQKRLEKAYDLNAKSMPCLEYSVLE